MGLFSPWFLAGLVAVALPFWLHLLRQFKRTPRPFSSLMFFERRIQSSTKHRRLRYLALLTARVLLLALLALAFANPFVYRKAGAASLRRLTILAIDRSFSMKTHGRMEAAKAEARRIIDSLPGQSRVQVIAFDSHLETLTEPDTSRAAISAAVNSIQPGDDISSYGELSRALRVMDQASGMRLDVHVITDVQQTSMPSAFTDLQVGPHTSELIQAVGKRIPNWAVESVSAPGRVFGSGNAKISATVAVWNGEAGTKKVSVLLDGRVVASKDVIIPSCGSAKVDFDNVEIPFGTHRGEVRIDSHDDLPNDDRFPFSIERSDPRRVLFLFSMGRAGQAFYYKSALESSAASGLVVEPSPLEQLDRQQLPRFAFAVLNDPPQLDDRTLRALMDYVRNGGSILVALGARTIDAAKVPLTGNELFATTVMQGAGQVDNNSSQLAGLGQLENVAFLRTPRIRLTESDHLLARFADGSPLLFERRIGEGRIVVFASSLDNSTSDFPLHTSFLPFVSQTAAYLSASEDTPSSVVVATPVVLRRTREQATAADVVGPDGHHELPLSEATRALSYDLTTEGFYEVQRANGQRVLIAVHADRRESDLTPIPGETMALWQSVGSRAKSVPLGTVEQTTEPWSLWRYIVVLLLIAAIIESILAGRYLRREKQAI